VRGANKTDNFTAAAAQQQQLFLVNAAIMVGLHPKQQINSRELFVKTLKSTFEFAML
jgi:hypothetical protein